MYYSLGQYNPSIKYTQTYSKRTIIDIYKKITAEKLTKMNTLLDIYQHRYNINKRVKHNTKHSLKPHNQIINI